MATIAIMVGGALVNALAFSGSNYLFSHMSGDDRKRHDKAIEDLQAAQAAWSKKRAERLDYLNSRMTKELHAKQTFDDVDEAMSQYYSLTGKRLASLPEPTLNDFYTPSPEQKNRELLFVGLGMVATGVLAYKML